MTKEDIHPMYFAGVDSYRKKLQIQQIEKEKAGNLVAQHEWKLKLKGTQLKKSLETKFKKD